MNQERVRPAVVLLSGGLDSTTVAAIALADGYAVHALSFDYGQRHGVELEAARRVARALHIADHLVIDFNLRRIGGSSLTSDIPVPVPGRLEDIGHEIPSTYVPARNTIFLAFALAWAETLGAADIFVGVNALDYSGYPDCRPEFIRAFEALANLATKAATEDGVDLKVHAPLMKMDKAAIIQRGIELGVDYGLTHSCYDPCDGGAPCGQCDSCLLRKNGFDAAGLTDPLDGSMAGPVGRP